LKAVVGLVGNPNIPRTIESYAGWMIELAIPTAGCSEFCDVRPAASELLDALVVLVSDPDVPRSNSYSDWSGKLAVATARGAELLHVCIVCLGRGYGGLQAGGYHTHAPERFAEAHGKTSFLGTRFRLCRWQQSYLPP